MKKQLSYKLSVLIPLLVSLYIYMVYRVDEVGVNLLGSCFFGKDAYTNFLNLLEFNIPFSDFIVFSLPGGLWVFSLTLVSKTQTIQIGNLNFNLTLLPIIYAVGLELCQLLLITDGQFDLFDIIAYSLACICAFYCFDNYQSKNKIGLNLKTIFLLSGYVILCLANVY